MKDLFPNSKLTFLCTSILGTAHTRIAMWQNYIQAHCILFTRPADGIGALEKLMLLCSIGSCRDPSFFVIFDLKDNYVNRIILEDLNLVFR